MSVQDKLVQQILSQNLTSKWTGEGLGSAEANARDMARMLAEAGITDIKQFGPLPVYQNLETQYLYNGVPARKIDDKTVLALLPVPNTSAYEWVPAPIEHTTKRYGTSDDIDGFVLTDPSQVKFVDGKPVLDTGRTTYGNKATNQPITTAYNKMGGNTWGGTVEGAGTTSYKVDFTPDGTPVFYTAYSSNNNAKDFLPLLGIAGLALGAPMLGEFLGGAGAAGAGVGAGMGAAELAALDLALGGAGGSLGAAELGAALAGGGAGAGAGMLESVFDPTFGGELAPVIGGGAESVFDPTSGGSALDAGMNAYPNTGNIGSPSSIKLSDAKRALDVANKLTGGTQPTGTAGTAANTAAANAAANELAQQQASNAALLNLLGSKPELANIKSYKELFGEDLFGGKYVPPSAGGAQSEVLADYGSADNPSTASQNEDEQQLFTGGHVDDFDVDALLQILRS
jgi:hypothetical protein